MSYSLSASVEVKSPECSPGMVIVKFATDDKSAIQAFLNCSGAYSSTRAFPVVLSPSQRLSAVYLLEFSPGADIVLIAQQYKKDPVVEYAQPNYLNRLCSDPRVRGDSGEPDDLFYKDQWALQAIEAPEAWKIEKGSPNVLIAIVDTGVDYNHEDLKSRIWINPDEIESNGLDDDGNGYVDDIRGWDFVDSPYLPSDVDYLDRDNDPMDENGHGTHVAGIVAAVPDNSTGIAGVTWNCRIMALRAGGKLLEDDDVSAAIVYAADNGARVINMSWGDNFLSYVVRDAVEYAYSRGCILVAAAGNENLPSVIYPALHKHVIAVGATDRWDKKASFSNYGSGVDIAAPGHKVFGTTLNDRYSDWSGTSMATPVVSGVAALMISKRPGLTNEEVYQILRYSADKIAEPLFSGAGRVNAAKALIASVPLIAAITSPDSGTGADKTLTIKGTAAGFSFRGFQLEYSLLMDTEPETQDMRFEAFEADDSDWKPIGYTQNASLFDAPLGTWDVANLDEGNYAVRLTVFGDADLKSEDKVILNVDHSPPIIMELQVVPKLQGDKYRYAVAWRTDDLTSGEIYYRSTASESEFQRIMSPSVTNEHVVYVSDDITPGNYKFFVTATNTAGLSVVDNNDGIYYAMEVKMLRVPSDVFLEVSADIPAMHPMSWAFDLDRDGQREIIGMDTKWQYDIVRIYEKDSAGDYKEVFASDEGYFPWDAGNTDKDDLLEILGSKNDRTFIYESPSAGSYPSKKIWEVQGIWGGCIADMDMDGNREIVSRHLDSGEVYIYENRGDNSYLRAARLQNPTEGDNYLAATFAISDFDGDGQTEIVIGDWDGDLFIYENIDFDRYSHTWMGNVPHSHIRYITAGDFDGDGKDEFVVGARVAEPYVPANQRWIYTIFDCFGDNSYEAVWSREIIGMKDSESAVSAGDVDSDGQKEIAILVTPYIYIFKVTGQSPAASQQQMESDRWNLEPIWYHSAEYTQRPILEDLDYDGINYILFNTKGKLTMFKWHPTVNMPIQRPWGLSAIPLGENEVELRWNGPSDAHSYKVYRGIDQENLQFLSSTETGYFRDSGLEKEVTYWYSVTSVSSAGKESLHSQEASAMPNSPPRLLSAEYVPPLTLRLNFSEPMGPSAQNADRYTITPGHGNSFSSAILDSQEKRVVATLCNPLEDGTYVIAVSEVRDTTGVPVSVDGNSVTFQVISPDVRDFRDLSQLVVYPNPVMPNSRHPGWIAFGNLPTEATINIYDCNGHLVRKLDEAEYARGRILWYLDNHEHHDVASGLYIYIVECADSRKVGKLAVVR